MEKSINLLDAKSGVKLMMPIPENVDEYLKSFAGVKDKPMIEYFRAAAILAKKTDDEIVKNYMPTLRQVYVHILGVDLEIFFGAMPAMSLDRCLNLLGFKGIRMIERENEAPAEILVATMAAQGQNLQEFLDRMIADEGYSDLELIGDLVLCSDLSINVDEAIEAFNNIDDNPSVEQVWGLYAIISAKYRSYREAIRVTWQINNTEARYRIGLNLLGNRRDDEDDDEDDDIPDPMVFLFYPEG